MKKLTILLVLILAGYLNYAQDCGSYIELIGIGMAGKSEATLTIDDPENVEKIIVEAIHKSDTDPTTITFSSSLPQSEDAEPVEVKYSGLLNMSPSSADVYRAELDPAEFITIHAGTNKIFSFSAYVYRKAVGFASLMEGELYHVYENEKDPLVMDIPLPHSENLRDITVRFGVSELNSDDRYAIFTLKAGNETEGITIETWDDMAGEVESYTIQEVKFEDVPPSVDRIEMTLISPLPSDNGKGDSFIAGVVLVDIPCEYKEYDGYCTYTQGYYGNKGGKTCAGETTWELLAKLLYDDLVMGEGDNTFTIPAGGVQCVLDILPGGGPSQILEGNSSCEDLGTIPSNKQGRIKNSLLAQGITLALNLRNSPDLMDFPVNGDPFWIRQTEDCKDPEATGIPGTEKEFSFGHEIKDYFGAEATIADLLDLVNRALGGGVIEPLNLSNVADAANLVNEAFDECVVVLDQEPVIEEAETGGITASATTSGGSSTKGVADDSEEEASKKEITGISDIQDSKLGIYPNPVSERFFFSLPSGSGEIRSAVIYSISGSPVRNLVLENIEGNENSREVEVDHLQPGIYIIMLETETGSFGQRFGVQ